MRCPLPPNAVEQMQSRYTCRLLAGRTVLSLLCQVNLHPSMLAVSLGKAWVRSSGGCLPRSGLSEYQGAQESLTRRFLHTWDAVFLASSQGSRGFWSRDHTVGGHSPRPACPPLKEGLEPQVPSFSDSTGRILDQAPRLPGEPSWNRGCLLPTALTCSWTLSLLRLRLLQFRYPEENWGLMCTRSVVKQPKRRFKKKRWDHHRALKDSDTEEPAGCWDPKRGRRSSGCRLSPQQPSGCQCKCSCKNRPDHPRVCSVHSKSTRYKTFKCFPLCLCYASSLTGWELTSW